MRKLPVPKRAFLPVLLVTVFLSSISIGSAQDAESNPATLDSLKLDYDVKRSELQKPIWGLEDIYEEKLSELLDQVTAAGDLQKALAVKKELSSFRETEGGSEEESGESFSELERLQEIYAESREQREASIKEQMVPLTKAYGAKLAQLQKLLTQEKKIDQAIAVQEVIKSLEKENQTEERPPLGMEEKPDKSGGKHPLIGKTISWQHERQEDFTVRLVVEKDGESTFIGLGDHAVPWVWEAGETPDMIYFWAPHQRTKETGWTFRGDPEGREGTVTRLDAKDFSAPAKISRSRR